MAKKQSLTEERRERYIEKLIEEAIINVLAEQEIPPSPVPPSPVPPAPETNAIDPASEMPDEEFTVDRMVDKLNVVRGGKSFTDPEVYGRLVTFFNSLTVEERDGIDRFLTELGGVVIDAAEEEVEPQETPPAAPQRQAQPPAPTAQAPQSAPVAPSRPVSPSNI
jgi:hypothetical protein